MAEIVCFTGQSFDAVERMTWPNYLSLLKHWSRWPPMAISSAFAAGLAPQQRENTETIQASEEVRNKALADMQRLMD